MLASLTDLRNISCTHSYGRSYIVAFISIVLSKSVIRRRQEPETAAQMASERATRIVKESSSLKRMDADGGHFKKPLL